MSDASDAARNLIPYRRKAERVAKSPERTQRVAGKALAKLAALRPALSALRKDLPLLIRLAKAWALGEYREIPWRAIVTVIAAVLYFLAPIDAIPDAIPIIGLLDDTAVVAYVVRKLSGELDQFRVWEGTRDARQRAQAA
jgi:uncharacterized membrane protein YkvA (DUF1232 family)